MRAALGGLLGLVLWVPAAAGTVAGPVAAASAPAAPVVRPAPRKGPAPVAHLVDLNSASRKELMTLPGIGPEQADRIAARRPYLTKNELVTKGALGTGPFLSLRHLVVAMPPGLAAGSTKRAAETAAAQGGTR